MDATLALGGIIGKPESRRGRGAAVIGGGSVLDMPLLTALVKFSNLQLPMNERLNLAHGAFYVEGPVVAFEELSISSNSVKLYGYGTGLTAFLLKHALTRRGFRDISRRLVQGVALMGAANRASVEAGIDKALLRREIVGMLHGPVHYARARRRLRRTGS